MSAAEPARRIIEAFDWMLGDFDDDVFDDHGFIDAALTMAERLFVRMRAADDRRSTSGSDGAPGVDELEAWYAMRARRSDQRMPRLPGT